MNKILFPRYLWAWLCLLAVAACNPPAPDVTTVSGGTMGTTYTVKYIAPQTGGRADAAAVRDRFEAMLADINRQMSTYDPESEISRFNRAGVGESVTVGADFAQVLNEALRLHGLTGGALDITIGPLVNVWGFGPDKSVTRTPDSAALAAARQQVGLDKIRIRPQADGAALTKLAEGVALDVSAIAKGFAVDQLAQHLDALGVQHYLVEIGGELRAKGYNAQGVPWRVGIETPQAGQHGHAQLVLPLRHQALATSGDYRNFRIDEHGRRLSHIIDPASGQPIRHHLASVSVVADNAATADGLATALFVLGDAQALALAERHGWAVLVIVHSDTGFRTAMSPALERLINE